MALCSIYALIALGYTMVYGVLRFINFAHGDVFVVGAFCGFYLAPQVNKVFPAHSVAAAVVVLLAAMLLCAALGIIIEKLAYRPLRSRPKLTVLITAIGVSLFIEYVGQHPKVFGPSPQTFPDLVVSRNLQFGGVVVSNIEVIVLALTLVLLIALRLIFLITKIGTSMRAASFNSPAAVLFGLNIDHSFSCTTG